MITGVYRRTAKKYGKRARCYVQLEAGHASENILLQAVALELGTVVVGAFDDQEVQHVLDLPAEHEPLLVIPVGFPPERAEHYGNKKPANRFQLRVKKTLMEVFRLNHGAEVGST